LHDCAAAEAEKTNKTHSRETINPLARDILLMQYLRRKYL
jgi:hypothetical protein